MIIALHARLAGPGTFYRLMVEQKFDTNLRRIKGSLVNDEEIARRRLAGVGSELRKQGPKCSTKRK